MEQMSQNEERERSVEERQEIALGLINAARNAVRNGEPVEMSGLNPKIHSSETVGYIGQLSRMGRAALFNEHHTL